MKKAVLTLAFCLTALVSGLAQSMDGIIAQPTHIIGKRINASGEVTKTLEADFTYRDDGKPTRFEIPEYELTTKYFYDGDYLTEELSYHSAGHPSLQEILKYTYEDGKVKTAYIYWSHFYKPEQYWEYTYGEDGRLARKDYLEGLYGYDEFHQHYLYEYENEGKTKIENYWTSWVSEGWKLRKTTVFQYDDEYKLLTKHVESYDLEGELTGSTLYTYTYTESGNQETLVSQTLTDGEWVNNSLMRYVYDDNGRVLETQYGTWSAATGEWIITQKVVFELSEDGTLYTVSFYRKSGEEWVWNTFSTQTIFFGSALANQQRTMRFFRNEEYNGNGLINQFEISLVYTEEPNYMGTGENILTKSSVYPNPGRDNLKVQAPVEDAVIRFYNLQGKLVLARPFDFSTEINTESWGSGMYLWEIWHDNQRQASGKWVKE